MSSLVRHLLFSTAMFAFAATFASAQNRNATGGSAAAPAGGDQAQKQAITGPQPRSQPQVPYPYEMAMAGTEGSADVTHDVDDQGVPRNIKVVKASHPEFGQAMAAAIETVRFMPAQKDGKAVGVTNLAISFKFTKDWIDAALVAEAKKPTPAFVGFKDVDGGLKPIIGRFAEPLFPEVLSRANVAELKATVEFIIDTDGSCHLPRIVSASHTEFGWASAAAVLAWRFQPPMKDGKPVRVRGALPFHVIAASAANAPAAAAPSPAKK